MGLLLGSWLSPLSALASDSTWMRENLLLEAHAALDTADFERLASIYELMLDLNPEDKEARRLLYLHEKLAPLHRDARRADERGERRFALELFREILALNPFDVWAAGRQRELASLGRQNYWRNPQNGMSFALRLIPLELLLYPENVPVDASFPLAILGAGAGCNLRFTALPGFFEVGAGFRADAVFEHTHATFHVIGGLHVPGPKAAWWIGIGGSAERFHASSSAVKNDAFLISTGIRRFPKKHVSWLVRLDLGVTRATSSYFRFSFGWMFF